MFIKKRCWDEAGGFDDRFFAHMEEIDLCWRLKNKGYKIMYCAESEVFHLGGGTLNVENPFKTFLNFRNNLLLLQNNLPFWRALLIIPLRICMDLLAIFRFLGEGKRIRVCGAASAKGLQCHWRVRADYLIVEWVGVSPSRPSDGSRR